jgi:cell wall-associated NlpC family hydrolase
MVARAQNAGSVGAAHVSVLVGEVGGVAAPPAEHSATALRAAIVAEARSWVGTPFVLHADVRGIGIDCVFLVLRTYQAAGVVPADFPDPRPYPSGWARDGVGTRYRDELLVPYFVELPPTTPRLPADLLLYKEHAAEAHSAIVTAWPMVIHAYPRENVIEDAADRNALGTLTLTSVWRPKALAI